MANKYVISEFNLGQLRHLYKILIDKNDENLKSLANGLLSPVIKNVENGRIA